MLCFKITIDPIKSSFILHPQQSGTFPYTAVVITLYWATDLSDGQYIFHSEVLIRWGVYIQFIAIQRSIESSPFISMQKSSYVSRHKHQNSFCEWSSERNDPWIIQPYSWINFHQYGYLKNLQPTHLFAKPCWCTLMSVAQPFFTHSLVGCQSKMQQVT